MMGYLLAFVLGGACGAVVMALLAAHGRREKREAALEVGS